MLNLDEIRKLSSEDMNKDVDKAGAIHAESMNLIKDVCKQVLEYSNFVGYLFFVATLEKFFTGMLDEVSTIEPAVNEIRRIVRMSETEVFAELSDKLGGDNGLENTVTRGNGRNGKD